MFPESLEHLFLFFGPFSLIVQILLCVHVLRTGRPYWWIFVIMMGSLLGAIVYALVEVLPEARQTGRHALNFSWFIPKSIIIRRLQEELEEGPTVDKRLTLASLLHEAGRREEADEVASEAVGGVFKDDPNVVSEASWYKLELGRADEAAAMLARVSAGRDRQLQARLALLHARVKLCRGEFAAAQADFDALQDSMLGEEPRLFAADCRARLGRFEESRALYQDIIRKYRKGTPVWRRAEKAWFKLAKARLKLPLGMATPQASAGRKVFG